jgi:DNA-binding XRE family transcriptional regulator
MMAGLAAGAELYFSPAPDGGLRASPQGYRLPSMTSQLDPTTRTSAAELLAAELGMDRETPSERLARELAEADINLIDCLRRAREARGMSQKALGDKMGVSQATVSDFESGTSEPKLSTIRRYAHALEVLVVHSVRPHDFVPTDAFMWTSVTTSIPSMTRSASVSNYAAVGSRRTDFALGA